MQTVLRILTLCTTGVALLLLIAVSVMLIAFILKLRKIGFFNPAEKEETSENEHSEKSVDISRLVQILREIVQNLDDTDKRTAELGCKLEEIDRKLNKLIEENNDAPYIEKITELERKLAAETDKNKTLTARVSELEAEKLETKPASEPDVAASERIKELEELVNYKDEYYAEIFDSEKKLRVGVCDAIDTLIRTRGSNSIEYLEEKIENVIKILDDSCALNQ